MARPPLPRRRLLLSTILSVALALETAGLVLALQAGAPPATPAPTPAGVGWVPRAAAFGSASLERRSAGAVGAPDARRAGVWYAAARPGDGAARVRPSLSRGATVRPAIETAARTATADERYRGRNHVWIPALGIDRSVSAFPCSRTRPPDNVVYRWGCAGANNVYLLGHAYSVFEPLHDAYVSGRLRKGLEVFYADGRGRVRTYAVTWWRVTLPTAAAKWAWAPQSRPSMTLQTCVGADSQYRLIVRLVARD